MGKRLNLRLAVVSERVRERYSQSLTVVCIYGELQPAIPLKTL